MEKDTKIVLGVVVVVIVVLAIIFVIINLNVPAPAAVAPPPSSTSASTITVYKDVNYAGSSQEYGVGSYTLPQMQAKGTTNDSISSVKIPSGYTVTFYQDDKFQGQTIMKSANDPNFVDDGWNDKVSSMVVTKVQ